MPLEILKILNGRNLKEYTLNPHPSLNIIYGDNGVGKTTILESVYLLLRSRTFRSSKYKNFINQDENSCTVFARFSSNNVSNSFGSFSLGIKRSKDFAQPILHLNSKKINSLSTITHLVVLGLITPESFNLLDAGPAVRRKFIDWGVFHVEPKFLSDWRSYKKILSSRNSLLSKYSKSYRNLNKITKEQTNNLDCWVPQLVILNNKLNDYRRKQIDLIKPFFYEYLNKFSEGLSDDIILTYYQGWNKDLSYEEFLIAKLKEDLLSGFTRYGTHRSELRIQYKKNLARDILSRGQKKIVIICLILAQFRFLIDLDESREHNLLLLDDIDSELDSNNLRIFFDILKTFKAQILVTTTNSSKYEFLDEELHLMFHIE